MQNGYALCTRAGLDGIREHLSALSPDQLDILRGQLRIGIHRDVEVTDIEGRRRPLVSQVFCSALPVVYTRVPPSHWEAFASLVLEAAYEATMLAALLNANAARRTSFCSPNLARAPSAIMTTGFTPPAAISGEGAGS